MKKVFNIFENKRNIAALFLLGGLIFNTYKIQENSSQVKKITNLENGIQTCFARVNQTFTANLLKDKNSNYLTQNFQNLTEECFAEGVLAVEAMDALQASSISKKLNNLASNVHWFHEDILVPAASKKLVGKSKDTRNIGERFGKIETTKDEILDSTNNKKEELSKALNVHKNIFFIGSTLLVILMIAELMGIARRRIANGLRESEASAELSDMGGIHSVKVGHIIKNALLQNELDKCSQLFTNYYNHQLNEKSKSRISAESLVTPVKKKEVRTEVSQKTIDQMWADDSYGLDIDSPISNESEENIEINDVNIEKITGTVVDLLAEKLFAQGVQIDVNVPENLMVRGSQEELEQALYYLFSFAINSSKTATGEKNISVFSHKLGEVVTFDISFSGTGFDNEILKKRVGLDSLGGELDLDLKICQGILDVLEAKVQLDNKLNQAGEISGGKVKIILKGGKLVTKGKLVDLKIGSKQEILKALKDSTSVSI